MFVFGFIEAHNLDEYPTEKLEMIVNHINEN
jgi:hypothetical protein